MSDSYKDAYKGLQENIGDVLIWNQHVDNEKKRLKEDMETEKNNLRAAKRAQEELDEEKQDIDNNLEMLQSDREMFREQAGKLS
jgi:phosphoenolpyruvate-protein kinase (PTS system EI component)